MGFARLEEERTEFEVDRRRFRDFDAQLAAERVKVVEAHSAGKLAADALKEQLNKAENEALALRRMMEARSTEMANAPVLIAQRELAVQPRHRRARDERARGRVARRVRRRGESHARAREREHRCGERVCRRTNGCPEWRKPMRSRRGGFLATRLPKQKTPRRRRSRQRNSASDCARTCTPWVTSTPSSPDES